MSDTRIFNEVKENYGKIAKLQLNGNAENCCGSDSTNVLSLGCYNGLVNKAKIKEGDVVLDLGSGPGHDLIQAAQIIGSKGRAIGVDMTEEMLELGRKNTSHIPNIEIIQGNLQDIPLPDNSVDVIISNCVFNLTPDKLKAFSEAYRVLKPGGRIVESDIALEYELSKEERKHQQIYSGCIGGAISKNEYLEYMKKAGFRDIKGEFQHSGTYTLNLKQYEYHSILFSGRK